MEIQTLVSNLGFPVVICVAIGVAFWRSMTWIVREVGKPIVKRLVEHFDHIDRELSNHSRAALAVAEEIRSLKWHLPCSDANSHMSPDEKARFLRELPCANHRPSRDSAPPCSGCDGNRDNKIATPAADSRELSATATASDAAAGLPDTDVTVAGSETHASGS